MALSIIMKNDICPICLSNNSVDYLLTHDFRLHTTKSSILLKKCCNSMCMHIWSAIIPSKKEIKSFYKDEFYQHSKKSTDLITYLNRKRFLKCINNNKSGRTKVLDVGAGDGSLVLFNGEIFKTYNEKITYISASGAKYEQFRTFAIKLVMTLNRVSQDSFIGIPKIINLRAIALDSEGTP